ncbi:MAG: hypothetical protein ACKOXI_02200 [Candidatus Planktophila sp.]
MKGKILGLSPWTGIFAITFLFQLFRKELVDAFIFGGATIVLLLQPLFHLTKSAFPLLKIDKRAIWTLISFFILLASFLPRQSLLLSILFIILGVILFLELWGVGEHKSKLDRLHTKGAWVWGTVALSISLIELSALVMARVTGEDERYATISELLVPQLDTQFNRFLFGLIWIFIGYIVVRHWRRK